jgi:hypothetical protein
MGFEEATTEEHERRIRRCRSESCRARIIWLKTVDGKNMPTDADSVKPEDTEFDPKRHVSHFSTCKDPDHHRKPRPPRKPKSFW